MKYDVDILHTVLKRVPNCESFPIFSKICISTVGSLSLTIINYIVPRCNR